MVSDAGQFSTNDFAEQSAGLSFRFLARTAKTSFIGVSVSLALFGDLLATPPCHKLYC